MDEKIKVTDKRMFDANGELREEYRQDARPEGAAGPAAGAAAEPKPAGAPSPGTAEAAGANAEPVAPGRPGPADRLGSSARPSRYPAPGFMDLIGLIAQPIAMFLGDSKLPDGSSTEDLDLARYHIDLLELLQQKAKGNLSPQEDNLIAGLLYRFRMRYIEKAG